MVKQLATAFVLLIFMSHTFSNLFIVADYFIYTDSFAVNCINKDKPQLGCNGKCQMSNQIQKQEQNNKPLSGSVKEKEQQTVFLNEYLTIEINIPISGLLQDSLHYCFAMQTYISSFFHPPSEA